MTNREPDDELLSQLGRIADEFTDRVNRGDAPDMEEYLRRHSELSGVLRPVLQAVLALKADRPTPVAEAAVPLRERPGTIIGSYKLLQQIGEGGMGVVFMAEQTHPVQRKVALKVIKPGMDSRAGHRPLRGRAAGPGDDGPRQHRPGPRRRRHGSRPAVLRHGAGPRRPDHQVLRRQPPDAARAAGAVRAGLPGDPARRTRRASSTATSSRRTSWSRSTTAGRSPR